MKISLKSRPWHNLETPPPLLKPIGMVGPIERNCYYWLAKNHLSSTGFIVDAGSFLGAATYCFAYGADEGGNGRRGDTALIHSYDYFEVVDQYVGEAIARDFRPIVPGESYLDIFQSQTAEFSDLIETYAGDFLSHSWSGDPVDLLFIDIAKTAELNAHAVGQFFDCLTPGKSILIHQDYYHCWHPYIHYSMEFFRDEFDLIDEHVPYQSRVWQLRKKIPEEKIARIAQMDLTNNEIVDLMNRLIEGSSVSARPMNELVLIWQHCLDREFDMASRAMRRFKSDWLQEPSRALWATQAIDVDNYIAKFVNS